MVSGKWLVASGLKILVILFVVQAAFAAEPGKKFEQSQLMPIIAQFQNDSVPWFMARDRNDSLLLSVIAYLVSQNKETNMDSVYASEAKDWAAVAASKNWKAELHWVSNGDETGRILFEKLSGTGVKSSKCVGNGIKISASSKPVYSPNVLGNIRCSYTPQLTVTTCDGSHIDILTFGQTFNTSHKDQNIARQRMLENVQSANFSAWVKHLQSLSLRR